MKRSLLFLGLFAFFSTIALADDTPGDIIDRKDYDPNVPYYEGITPSWGVGFRFTVATFPKIPGNPAIYSLFAEKYLPFQQLGVFGAGVHLGTASFTFMQPFSGNNLLNLGASLRYQLYFMRNQIIVPNVSFIYDNFRYMGQAANSMGVMFGGQLNLGFFDRETARQASQSLSLVRSYLTVEYRPSMKLTSGGSSFVLGNAMYFGVLLELE